MVPAAVTVGEKAPEHCFHTDYPGFAPCDGEDENIEGPDETGPAAVASDPFSFGIGLGFHAIGSCEANLEKSMPVFPCFYTQYQNTWNIFRVICVKYWKVSIY